MWNIFDHVEKRESVFEHTWDLMWHHRNNMIIFPIKTFYVMKLENLWIEPRAFVVNNLANEHVAVSNKHAITREEETM